MPDLGDPVSHRLGPTQLSDREPGDLRALTWLMRMNGEEWPEGLEVTEDELCGCLHGARIYAGAGVRAAQAAQRPTAANRRGSMMKPYCW